MHGCWAPRLARRRPRSTTCQNAITDSSLAQAPGAPGPGSRSRSIAGSSGRSARRDERAPASSSGLPASRGQDRGPEPPAVQVPVEVPGMNIWKLSVFEAVTTEACLLRAQRRPRVADVDDHMPAGYSAARTVVAVGTPIPLIAVIPRQVTGSSHITVAISLELPRNDDLARAVASLVRITERGRLTGPACNCSKFADRHQQVDATPRSPPLRRLDHIRRTARRGSRYRTRPDATAPPAPTHGPARKSSPRSAEDPPGGAPSRNIGMRARCP